MNLLWPGFLLLLGLIPVIILAYIWILRRRRRYAVRYSSLALVRQALPQSSRLRRHLPFALFLLGIASLILALVRPVASVEVPVSQTVVILAMDVSWSMCSSDIPPNRLKAAKDAALDFIRSQNSSTQIGVVAFAGFAQLVQPPTNDRQALEKAVRGLYTARRTAIGSAILSSLNAIAEMDSRVAPSDLYAIPEPGAAPAQVQEGDYLPHIIVLLTDGASNAGPYPLDAAQQAAERGIRVYTIGFGTPYGGPFTDCGDSFRSDDLFGGGGFGFGGGFRRGIDEGTLMQVADLTGGKYYTASSAHELQSVFKSIPISLVTRRETLEISVVFTAIGAFLAALAFVLAQLWHPLA
jgi:Ca-activated chloride channel family protein